MSVSAFPYGAISAPPAVGAPSPTVSLPTTTTINQSDSAPGAVSGNITALSNGDYTATGVLFGLADTWVADVDQVAGLGDDYEVRLTKSAGADPASGPALATWHTISSNIVWEWTQSFGAGTTSFTGTLEVREITNTANIDSSSVSVTLTLT